MNIFLQALLNGLGFLVCLLAISGLQWVFSQWLGKFAPQSFKQAEFKKRLVNSLYRGYNPKNNNESLNPLRQNTKAIVAAMATESQWLWKSVN